MVGRTIERGDRAAPLPRRRGRAGGCADPRPARGRRLRRRPPSRSRGWRASSSAPTNGAEPVASVAVPGGAVQVLETRGHRPRRGRARAGPPSARSSSRRSSGSRASSPTRSSCSARRPRWSTGERAEARALPARAGGAGSVNYEQAEAYLLDLELFGMRFGLDRMHKLMTVLGMPQRRFASIHVVGSNGKSSTARYRSRRSSSATGCAPAPTPRRTCARSPSGSRWGSGRSPSRLRRGGRRAWRARPRWSNRTADADDRVTQFEALTAAAYHELARRRRGGGGDRGRARRALGRHQRDPVEGPGAHLRRPRAHALAGPDARRHRRREARRGARPRDARRRCAAGRGARRWRSAWSPSATPGSSGRRASSMCRCARTAASSASNFAVAARRRRGVPRRARPGARCARAAAETRGARAARAVSADGAAGALRRRAQPRRGGGARRRRCRRSSAAAPARRR